MLIEYISVSRKKLFQECEQKYKYKYHLKLPSPEPTQIYFDYGKIVHKIIEVHTLEKGKRSINDITKDVLNGTIELETGYKAPKLPPDYINKLPKHLRQYMRLLDKIGFQGHVEWKFKIDLDPPNERYFLGFIDRIIQNKDEITVLDWKTTQPSRWRTNIHTVKTDLQLRAYCVVVQNEFKVPADKICAGLYFLDGGELIGAKYTEQTLETTRKELIHYHQVIQESDPEQVLGNVGRHCTRCEYKSKCPFYSLT